MKTTIFTLLCAILCCLSFAQSPIESRSWKSVANSMPAEWYSTAQAKSVAENILAYQNKTGGWPKNINMHLPITAEQRKAIPSLEPTIDNEATTTEMKFMAKMYRATADKRYFDSFERGLNYILESQYDNGGFPQFYPLRKGYYTHITFNDNAMVNVLGILRDISRKESEYLFICTTKTMAKAKTAFDKGIECILNTQIVVDGKPTVWCAQHDEITLAPAKARSYELPSFSGSESASIVILLMGIENPSQRIINSIDGAVAWFESNKIEGVGFELFKNDKGENDKKVVYAADAPVRWARFYDLETGKPYFCDRDGVKKESLNDIGVERRNGYSWYTSNPQQVLDKYPAWKTSLGK